MSAVGSSRAGSGSSAVASHAGWVNVWVKSALGGFMPGALSPGGVSAEESGLSLCPGPTWREESSSDLK